MNFVWRFRKEIEKRGTVKLFAFRGFAHDSQGVLAAVYRLAPVAVELLPNLFLCSIRIAQAGPEVGVASFADRKPVEPFFHYPQSAFHHIQSLAHREGWA
jgi:hypothetical protein